MKRRYIAVVAALRAGTFGAMGASRVLRALRGSLGALGAGAAAIAAVAATLPLPGHAAGAADVQRMIDALKPAAGAASSGAAARGNPSAGRTRNLVVEAAPAGPAAAPPPGAAPSTTSATAAPAPAAAATPAAPAPGATSPSAPPPASGTTPAGLSLAISFEPNSAQLRPESGGLIGALVAAMLSAELRQTRFVIEGHTDATGTAAQNLRLSRERAEQVRLALVTLGVSGERLSAVGKGSSEPVNARDPRSPENRRVRVVPVR